MQISYARLPYICIYIYFNERRNSLFTTRLHLLSFRRKHRINYLPMQMQSSGQREVSFLPRNVSPPLPPLSLSFHSLIFLERGGEGGGDRASSRRRGKSGGSSTWWRSRDLLGKRYRGDTERGERERERREEWSAGSLNEANKTVKAVQTAGKSNIGEERGLFARAVATANARFEGVQVVVMVVVVVVRFQRGRYMQAEAGGSRRQTENDRRAPSPSPLYPRGLSPPGSRGWQRVDLTRLRRGPRDSPPVHASSVTDQRGTHRFR